MSRSIQPVIDAFLKGKPKKISNTETDGSYLWLFGNCIAKKGVDGVFISNGGYVDKKDIFVQLQQKIDYLYLEQEFHK